jgi:hypothetical protein
MAKYPCDVCLGKYYVELPVWGERLKPPVPDNVPFRRFDGSDSVKTKVVGTRTYPCPECLNEEERTLMLGRLRAGTNTASERPW